MQVCEGLRDVLIRFNTNMTWMSLNNVITSMRDQLLLPKERLQTHKQRNVTSVTEPLVPADSLRHFPLKNQAPIIIIIIIIIRSLMTEIRTEPHRVQTFH